MRSPSRSTEAGPDNFCYWDGRAATQPPPDAGRVYTSKMEFAKALRWWEPQPLNDSLMSLVLRGEDCQIHGTASLGNKGFSFVNGVRMPHIGKVELGDRVEIGAFTTVDRAVVGSTRLGDDVKVDAHVHIGHNATIGARTHITAGAIIGGSAIIGSDCYIGLGAIIRNKVTVGDCVTIGMGSVVVKDVPSYQTIAGNPAKELM